MSYLAVLSSRVLSSRVLAVDFSLWGAVGLEVALLLSLRPRNRGCRWGPVLLDHLRGVLREDQFLPRLRPRCFLRNRDARVRKDLHPSPLFGLAVLGGGWKHGGSEVKIGPRRGRCPGTGGGTGGGTVRGTNSVVQLHRLVDYSDKLFVDGGRAEENTFVFGGSCPRAGNIGSDLGRAAADNRAPALLGRFHRRGDPFLLLGKELRDSRLRHVSAAWGRHKSREVKTSLRWFSEVGNSINTIHRRELSGNIHTSQEEERNFARKNPSHASSSRRIMKEGGAMLRTQRS